MNKDSFIKELKELMVKYDICIRLDTDQYGPCNIKNLYFETGDKPYFIRIEDLARKT